jgi:hypothetical protein
VAVRPDPASARARYGWQSDFPTFADEEPRVVRVSLQEFLAEVSESQVFAYLIGAVAVWSSGERQRLGDRAAGTIVVRSRPDSPSLRNDGTHRRGQADAEEFNVAVQSEIGRPPPR